MNAKVEEEISVLRDTFWISHSFFLLITDILSIIISNISSVFLPSLLAKKVCGLLFSSKGFICSHNNKTGLEHLAAPKHTGRQEQHSLQQMPQKGVWDESSGWGLLKKIAELTVKPKSNHDQKPIPAAAEQWAPCSSWLPELGWHCSAVTVTQKRVFC